MPEASAAETNALESALKLFTDRYYPLAETNFSNFLATYTNSAHRAYAILYLARSQLEQSNGASAIALLQQSFPDAGDLAAGICVLDCQGASEPRGLRQRGERDLPALPISPVPRAAWKPRMTKR